STGPHLHFEVRRNGVAIDPGAVVPFAEGGYVRGGPVLGLLNEALAHPGEVVAPEPKLREIFREELRRMLAQPPQLTQHIYGVLPGDVERETRRALRRMALERAVQA